MASWAVLGVPAAMGPVTMMSAAAASKGDKKGGLVDWLLNGALDKPTFSETDPILQKVEGAAPPPRPAAAPKKASPPKKQPGFGGGGFFGLGKK